MSLPVLQWAFRAAVEIPPCVSKHYGMGNHELPKSKWGGYSCTDFLTAKKVLFSVFTVILCTLLLLL